MARYNFLFGLVLVGAVLFAAAACASGKSVSREDLQHHRFVLSGVDGKPFSATMGAPDIEFNQDFRVAGSMCNRFMGQGELADNVLTVKQMASSKMFCPDETLNSLEAQLAEMLAAGAQVSLEGDSLTLRQGGRELTYTRKDRVN